MKNIRKQFDSKKKSWNFKSQSIMNIQKLKKKWDAVWKVQFCVWSEQSPGYKYAISENWDHLIKLIKHYYSQLRNLWPVFGNCRFDFKVDCALKMTPIIQKEAYISETSWDHHK